MNNDFASVLRYYNYRPKGIISQNVKRISCELVPNCPAQRFEGSVCPPVGKNRPVKHKEAVYLRNALRHRLMVKDSDWDQNWSVKPINTFEQTVASFE